MSSGFGPVTIAAERATQDGLMIPVGTDFPGKMFRWAAQVADTARERAN